MTILMEHIQFQVMLHYSCNECVMLLLSSDNSFSSVFSPEEAHEGIKHVVKAFHNMFIVFQLALYYQREQFLYSFVESSL